MVARLFSLQTIRKMREKRLNIKRLEEPLCDFCLSAGFFISSSPGTTQTAPSGRQFSFSIPSYATSRSGCVNSNNFHSSSFSPNIPELFSSFKKRKSLTLNEILDIVQNVWQAPKKSPVMETKSFNYENLSPTPQRRRLSVPETIMRKHYLAMERSNLQEFKNFNWDKEVECLSDPNLSRKKDFNLMRKSMLLRRLWGDSSKSRFSGSFQEWQHSCKKLSSTQSLNSNHSSPERKFKNAAASKKFNSSSNRSYEEQLYISNSPKRKVLSTPFSRESTTKYTYSTFTNATESNSDSAYSPSFTNSISSRCNNNHDENSNVRSCESSVQTRDVTNLNVISNVNLSQATLDVIFKEVMKDVRNLPTGDININTATVLNEENSVKIEKAPRFFIDANTELEKFIISKVRTGSPYLVSETQPTVPRFSAVPRTFSMEVNTSEEDKEEEESDTGSFVDSLEDFTSPRNFSNSQSSGVYQLLPEGKKEIPVKKSSAFFIPIQVNDKEAKSVSELLPVKVREKLNKRQQLREENSRVRRSSVPLTTSNINAIKSTLNSSSYLPKKRTKPVLPSIDFLKKSSSGENSARKSKAKTKEKGKKRIEILEIMECVDLSQKKSRIPLPVTKTEFDKPVYLDLDNHNSRDKDVDQLIANILIDTLNQDQESDLKNANVKDSNAKKNDNNEIKNNNLNPKSKSSIPKGWVTVYTMQKDLKTPESTSDEGKKFRGRSEKVPGKYSSRNNNKKFKNNTTVSSINQGSQTSFLGDFLYNLEPQKKTFNQNNCYDYGSKSSVGDWSVVISGSNTYGQTAPDVEMRLKFPKNKRSGSSSSNEKENCQTTQCNFPKIDVNDKKLNKNQLKEKPLDGSLPKIQTSRKLIKREGSLLSMTSSVIIPRQTKTSTSRYYFSRPRERYSLPDVPSILNERQYCEIVKRIPDILTVTGRSISPERRSFE